jgi:hypothetical protein
VSAAPRRKKTDTPADAAAAGDQPRPPRVKKVKKPRDEEARLDRIIRKEYGTGPENLTPEQWRSRRELLRLQLLYPGKYVAFIDHHEGEDRHRRLVRREVLCVSRSLEAINRRLDKVLKTMPEGSQFRVHLSYVDPPDAPWF